MLQLENDLIKVQISEEGAELQSIFGKNTSIEYLWQGDPWYWSGKAPNLFPFIARLYKNTYTYAGKEYSMRIHGFLPISKLTVSSQGDDECTLYLEDSEETLKSYPFKFRFDLNYKLEGARLTVTATVHNKSDDAMYFALGGHPGFNVPLEKGLAFEDYELVFSNKCSPDQIIFDNDLQVSGDRSPIALENGTTLKLHHELFYSDAVVLKESSGKVSLSSPKGSHGVSVDYSKYPYIGFWQKYKKDTPYVCIEPWSALPGRSKTIEALEDMPERIKLEKGGLYSISYTIEVW